MAQNLINTVFVHGIYALFNLTLERANATHEIQQSPFKLTQGGDGGNQKKRKREREKSKASTTLSI